MAYSQLYYPPTQNGLQKTLGAALDSGITASMTLNNVTGIQDKPGVVVINRIDSNSTELSASLREYISFTGVSGSTLTGLTRGLGGTSDQDHAVGSVVEFIFDITAMQALIDFLLVAHSEADGTHTSGATYAAPVLSGTVTGTYTLGGTPTFPSSVTTLTGTQTLTNKRITKRTGTVASAAAPTINTDNVDLFTITAQAEAITSFTTNLSGTPTLGQTLIIRILDNGTARAITWGNSFASRGATLPTTTTLSKYTYVGFIYNTTTSTWDCVATATEA